MARQESRCRPGSSSSTHRRPSVTASSRSPGSASSSASIIGWRSASTAARLRHRPGPRCRQDWAAAARRREPTAVLEILLEVGEPARLQLEAMASCFRPATAQRNSCCGSRYPDGWTRSRRLRAGTRIVAEPPTENSWVRGLILRAVGGPSAPRPGPDADWLPLGKHRASATRPSPGLQRDARDGHHAGRSGHHPRRRCVAAQSSGAIGQHRLRTRRPLTSAPCCDGLSRWSPQTYNPGPTPELAAAAARAGGRRPGARPDLVAGELVPTSGFGAEPLDQGAAERLGGQVGLERADDQVCPAGP